MVTHILLIFRSTDLALGDNDSELKVKANTALNISVKAAGFLTETARRDWRNYSVTDTLSITLLAC